MQICIMHRKKKYITAAWHLLFWLAYFLYAAIDDGGRHRDSWGFDFQLSALNELPVSMIVVYVNMYLLLPVFYKSHKYLQYIAWVILLLVIGGLIDRFFSWTVWLPRERFIDPNSREPTQFWIFTRIIEDSIANFPLLLVTLVLILMRDSAQNEKKLREIEKEKFTAEMNVLKAQINPHFFFNTLNSLYSLTLPISKEASDVVVRLSDLMRYMLYDASANQVQLKDEIVHLENYIAIEHMRFTDRLDLSFQHSGDIDDKIISPLLLLPFIENAFKHGIGDNSGWITVDLQVVGNRLFLKVENSCPVVLGKKEEGGLGLTNVKRRLELIYPGGYDLNIEQAAEIFAVELKIDL
ncbi:two-component system LytT family sensor kinase [Mucilaginibacter sp. UYP25]